MRDGAGSAAQAVIPGSYVSHPDGYLVRLAAKQAGGMNDAIKRVTEDSPTVHVLKTLEKFVRGRLDAFGAPGAKITFESGPSMDLEPKVDQARVDRVNAVLLNETLKLGTITFHTGPIPKTAEGCPGCALCTPEEPEEITTSMGTWSVAPRAGYRHVHLSDPKAARKSDANFDRLVNAFGRPAANAIREDGFDRPLYKPLADAPSKRTRDEATLEWALQQLDKLCTDLEMGTVSNIDTLLERMQKTWIGVSGGAQ